MDRAVQRRCRRELARILRRLYTTNRNTYLQQLKVRVRDTETSYVKRLKRSTTSMVSVFRNGSQGLGAPGRMSKGMGGHLWQYFNSPFNVVFMTTNIFAFAGIVAFSTLIDIRHLHVEATKNQAVQPALAGSGHGSGMLMVNPGTIRRHMYPMVTTMVDPQTERVPLPELPELTPEDQEALEHAEEQDQTLEFLRRKISEKSKELAAARAETETAVDVATAVETPLQTYTEADIDIPTKPTRVLTRNSTDIKASLFHMLYSYEIFWSLLQDSNKDAKASSFNSPEWGKEISEIRQNIPDFKGFVQNLNMFYNAWNEEFQESGAVGSAKSTPQSTENFAIPTWLPFPKRLQKSCKRLYANKLETVEDFQKFYEDTGSPQLKELLRMWFYDNYRQFQSKDSRSSEFFYNELLNDTVKNPPVFKKYASVVLNPANQRSQKMFSKVKVDEEGKVPVVHLDTMVNLLQDYLKLKDDEDRSDAYLRLVHMIKNNAYISPVDKGVYVQLCDDDKTKSPSGWMSRLHGSSDKKAQSQLYEALGQDQRLVSLLKELH